MDNHNKNQSTLLRSHTRPLIHIAHHKSFCGGTHRNTGTALLHLFWQIKRI